MTVEEKLLEYDRKLAIMQKQIDELNSEISALKSAKNTEKPRAYSLPVPPASMVSAPAADVVNPNTISPAATGYISTSPTNTAAPVVKRKEKAGKNLENAIGKQWMGIFASILIFISVIMFATIIAPNLSDGIKMVVMYIFSIGVTCFGIYKLHKHKDSSFFISVAGCGIGLIFISLLMSNIYFKVMNEWVLYGCILVWTAGVCVLSRYNSYVFQIIGHLGVLISVAFGTYLCCDRKDEIKIIVLAIFLLLTQFIFFFAHYKKRAAHNAVSHIFTAINSIVLLVGAAYLKSTPALGLILLLVVAMYNVSICLLDDEKEEGYIGAVGVIYSIIIFVTDMCFMRVTFGADEKTFICLSYFIFAEIIALIHYRKPSVMSSNMIKIASFVMAMLASLNMGAEFVTLMILSLVALLLAAIFRDTVYQYIGVIFGAFLVVFHGVEVGRPLYATGIITFVMAAVVLFLKYEQIPKGIMLATLYIYICKMFTDDPFEIGMENNIALYFGIVGILHIVAMKTKLSYNFITGEFEKGFYTYLSVINAILMLSGLIIIGNSGNLILLTVIVTVALFMMNAKRQLDNKEFAINMYVGIKFTLLLIVVLKALSIETIIISIACLLFAIICIVAGAHFKKKALRVYGLVLSNISIIKLILFDYNYQNTVGRAVGFLLSGILCFTISFIYTIIEKKSND